MQTSQSSTPAPLEFEDEADLVPMDEGAFAYWRRKRVKELREHMNSYAVVRGAGASVVLYVKTLPGEDAEPYFERLRAKAVGRGWRVVSEIHDDQGRIDPEASAAWSDLMHVLGGGFAHGVLTPTYQHISLDTQSYGNALYRVAERRCFTSLLIPEPST